MLSFEAGFESCGPVTKALPINHPIQHILLLSRPRVARVPCRVQSTNTGDTDAGGGVLFLVLLPISLATASNTRRKRDDSAALDLTKHLTAP